MVRTQSTSPEAMLHGLLPAEAINQAAHRLGFIKRLRRIKAAQFIVLVVLSVCGREGQSLSALRRRFIERTGLRVVRSSFIDRFTPSLMKVVHWMLTELQERAAAARPTLGGPLKGFADVVAVDATVIQVPRALAKLWKGTSTAAAIKVHTMIRALSGELLRHQITAETRHESRVFGIGHWAKKVLFLLDRGYASGSLYWRIHRVGGYFLTPLKKSFVARIVGVNAGHSGSASRALGKSVWDLCKQVGRRAKRIDVVCRFQVRVRPYGTAKGRRFFQEFRVVGLYNHKERRYHFYVTNIEPERLKAADCASLYRLRWEVETWYKSAKSGLALDEIYSAKPHIVRTLVKAALIRTTVAMQARRHALPHLPLGRWINPGQWLATWQRTVEQLLTGLMLGRRRYPPIAWRELAFDTMDPNRSRVPTRRLWALSAALD